MRDRERRRVVVTGIGMISPLGSSLQKTWDGILAGKSGIGPITRFDATGLETTIAGEVRDFDPLEHMDRKEVRRADRFAQFAVAVAAQALADARLEVTPELAPRLGVAFGSGIGGVETLVDNILSHDKDPRKVAPEKASRPFDRERDGFVFSEGAGCLVLEGLDFARARGATILAELLGYGQSADAYHVTAPPPGGEGAVRAMQMAITDADVPSERIGYVNAHGTSTQANDGAETAALKTVFGAHARKLAVSSTKSMTGHTLGAAGAIEAGLCILAMRDGVLPPTINQDVPDPECDLDYVPNRSRKVRVDVTLSNSMGFGGHNVALVIGRDVA